MMKPMCVIQSPLATRSGYGDMARDIARHIIDLDLYDVRLISLPWGSCPMTALEPVRDADLIKRILPQPVQLPRQPELYICISVPNEFQPMGKYNIGITAGIETTMISMPWIEGCNRMNTVWAISNHSVEVIKHTIAEERDQHGQSIRAMKVEVPLEVLHCCVNTAIFKKIQPEAITPSVRDMMSEISEKFCYLFVGHWMRGNMGEDRKNVGLLVKIFCEAFKNNPSFTRPALILKSSSATFSVLDREEVLNKIKMIRATVGAGCPNVYLIHGDLSEEEMNSLYNHPKVKVHVSFTKGEGFGRPLLEACMSEKPILASGWSGHLDFLNKDNAVLIAGELRPVEPGSVWENVIIPQSAWFNVDNNQAGGALIYAFKKYDQLLLPAKRLAAENRTKFSYDAIRERTKQLIEQYVPKQAVQVDLKLPTLKKLTK